MEAIIFPLSMALLAMVGCSKDSEEPNIAEEKTRQVRYLPDEETKGLKIAELSGDELIELAGRKNLSPQNLALILDRLRTFPGKETVITAISFIDRRDKVQMEILNSAGEKEEWELTGIRLGKVAISTLRAVTGEKISSPEGWLAWYQDHKDKLRPTEEGPEIIE